MTTYYPIVLETEASGAVSAYVPGLPVYAAADTRAKAERAIRTTLAAYLSAHPDAAPTSSCGSPASPADRKCSLWALAPCWARVGVSARRAPRN